MDTNRKVRAHTLKLPSTVKGGQLTLMSIVVSTAHALIPVVLNPPTTVGGFSMKFDMKPTRFMCDTTVCVRVR